MDANLYYTMKMYSRRMYSICSEAELLELIRTEIDPEITSIPPHWVDLINHFIKFEPCNLYNKDISDIMYDNLLTLYTQKPEEFIKGISYGLEYWFKGVRSYLEMANIIRVVESVDELPEIKTRLYRIPTYTQILESVLSNLFRFIRDILGCVNKKIYSNQNTLNNLKNILESNGFDKLFRFVDIDVRNSINHGGVIINPYDIQFVYASSGSWHKKEWTIRDIFGETAYALVGAGKPHFDDFIEGAFDDAGGLLLGTIRFFCKHNEVIQKNIDKIFADWYLRTEYLCRYLSYPGCTCTHIDTGLVGLSQLNINFLVSNPDHNNLKEHAFEAAILSSNWFPDYHRYSINYRHLRMPDGFIRFNKDELDAVVSNKILPIDVMRCVISRGDFGLLFKASDEDIELERVKRFRYPLIGDNEWMLREINDVSNEKNKRFQANLYVPHINTKDNLIKIIYSSINELKHEQNPPSLKMKIKHGRLPADAIYLKVFKQRSRRRYRSISPDNDNFICLVEWHSTDCPSLEHGGIPNHIWKKLKIDIYDNMVISWNPNT